MIISVVVFLLGIKKTLCGKNWLSRALVSNRWGDCVQEHVFVCVTGD